MVEGEEKLGQGTTVLEVKAKDFHYLQASGIDYRDLEAKHFAPHFGN